MVVSTRKSGSSQEEVTAPLCTPEEIIQVAPSVSENQADSSRQLEGDAEGGTAEVTSNGHLLRRGTDGPSKPNQLSSSRKQRTKFSNNDGKFSDLNSKSDVHPDSDNPRIVQSSLSKFSRLITSSIESSFFWYGSTIATYPGSAIAFCLILTGIASLGLLNFQTENRPFKLWIPQNSDFIKLTDWRKENFPSYYRFHMVIYEAENVLDRHVLLELLRVHEMVSSTFITMGGDNNYKEKPRDFLTGINPTISPPTFNSSADVERNVGWKNVCAKLPSIVSSPLFGKRRRRRDLDNSDYYPKETVADVLHSNIPTVTKKKKLDSEALLYIKRNSNVNKLNLNVNKKNNLQNVNVNLDEKDLSDIVDIRNMFNGIRILRGKLPRVPMKKVPPIMFEILQDNLESRVNNRLVSSKPEQAANVNNISSLNETVSNKYFQIEAHNKIRKIDSGSVSNNSNYNVDLNLDLDKETLGIAPNLEYNFQYNSNEVVESNVEHGVSIEENYINEKLDTVRRGGMYDLSEELQDGQSNGNYINDRVFQGNLLEKYELNEHLPGLYRMKRRDIDWSTYLPRGSYCSVLEQMGEECFERSILEVWGYDREYLESLTEDEIIDAINTKDTSAVFGFPTNFTDYLGGLTRDSEGRIVAAKAMIQTWLTKINPEKVITGKYIDDFGSGQEVDVDTFKWEELLINNLLNTSGRPDDINLYFMSASSFGRISGETIKSDLGYLILGFVVVFIYVQIMLGKFNALESRAVLSLLGISSVYLAMFVSYGIASTIGMKFGPVNNILPFLLLGLGIDDMFVIMQAWNNLSEDEREESLATRMGYTMKHAGASITVTSATDVIAFAIGSTTVLPALRSFCIYAAIGISAIYFFQATYFVACMTIDQRRLESNRNAFICCWKMSSKYKPNKCSQKDLCQSFFGNAYSNILLKPVSKVIVLVGTAVLFSVSCWGLSNLRQEFNAIWFLPHDSYMYKCLMARQKYFPDTGITGLMYVSNVSLYEYLPEIESIVQELESNEYIVEVDSWYGSFKTYFEDQGYLVPDPDMTEEDFQDDLSIFLHSASGSKYRDQNFIFVSPLNCSDPAPIVTASSIEFRFKEMKETPTKITAMHSIKRIAKNRNMSGIVSAYSRSFSEWETDEIIEKELYQNISLAILVVFLMTFALLASMTQSLLVMFCVIMTLVDVGAMMHWWGLTIDTVSCIDLVLAIGLCVDYAAHVGHVFMTCYGDRNARVRATLERIGPAVLNGGFSTFLAFSLLAGSTSHVFKTFFKVFFGVCLYGLYHGLVFLPVMLSLVGPKPYARYTPPKSATLRPSSLRHHQPDQQTTHRSSGIHERSQDRTVRQLDEGKDLELYEIDERIQELDEGRGGKSCGIVNGGQDPKISNVVGNNRPLSADHEQMRKVDELVNELQTWELENIKGEDRKVGHRDVVQVQPRIGNQFELQTDSQNGRINPEHSRHQKMFEKAVEDPIDSPEQIPTRDLSVSGIQYMQYLDDIDSDIIPDKRPTPG